MSVIRRTFLGERRIVSTIVISFLVTVVLDDPYIMRAKSFCTRREVLKSKSYVIIADILSGSITKIQILEM